jgi:hypothetical protein
MALGFSAGLAAGFALLTRLAAADPVGMYLPPSETGGSEFQFNPASLELRQAVKTELRSKDDLLDARALADDLGFLRRGLRKLYSGYPELLQLPDFDVEALFDQHIARLRAGPARVKYADSALALFLELKRHIVDRHFALYGPGWNPAQLDEYTEYQMTISGAAPSLAGCTAAQVAPTTVRLAPVLTVDGKRAQLVTVSARPQGPTLDLVCGQRHLTLTGRPRVSKEDDFAKKPAYEWRRAGEAAIIRIRRFFGTPTELEQLEQMVKDSPAHLRAPLIVIDMRGNDGGNDGYAYRWVNQAKRGAWETATWSMYPVGSFFPWQAWNQEVWAAISQDRVDDPASIAKRNQLREKWPRRPADLSIEFKRDHNQGDARIPYKGRVAVLLDRRCGSSGESAALAFQGGLGAKLVGERTAGQLEYGNVRQLALPRTHLVFQFPTKRNYFLTPIEGLGTPVDVYLAPELMAKPVEELIPLLKTLPRQ